MPEPRNWADLPGELIHFIYKRIPADRIYVHRFRAVCKNWRSSAPLSDPPPQLPWLIECDSPCRNSYLEPNLRFYSLAGGDTGAICVPEAYRTMVYYGPGNGYLFVSSLQENLYLLNPLTGYAISLPYLDYRFRIRSSVCSGSDPMSNWHIASCNMEDSNPNDDRWRSVIFHPEKNKWTYVKVLCRASCSTCCWDGKLFATEEGRGTEVYDAISGEKLYKAPQVDYEDQVYLVESCGDILRVSLYFVSDETDEVKVSMFDIYKLYSEGGGQYSWVEISDIGDRILFLDLMNGFSMRAPSGFKGNCIYFLLDDGSTPSRYDISTGTVEMLPCPFKSCTWFIPHLG